MCNNILQNSGNIFKYANEYTDSKNKINFKYKILFF